MGLELADGNIVLTATLTDSDAVVEDGPLVIWNRELDLHQFMFDTVKVQFDALVPKETRTDVNQPPDDKYELATAHRPFSPSDGVNRHQNIKDGDIPPIVKPTVIFGLSKRVPGANSAKPFTTSSQSLTYRETGNEGQPFTTTESHYVEFKKFFDNEVRFSCYATTMEQVWDLTECIEVLMDRVACMLKQKVHEKFLQLRTEEVDSEFYRNRIFRIDIFYYIRTVRLKYIRQDKIKEIQVRTDLAGYTVDTGTDTVYTSPDEENYTSALFDDDFPETGRITQNEVGH